MKTCEADEGLAEHVDVAFLNVQADRLPNRGDVANDTGNADARAGHRSVVRTRDDRHITGLISNLVNTEVDQRHAPGACHRALSRDALIDVTAGVVPDVGDVRRPQRATGG